MRRPVLRQALVLLGAGVFVVAGSPAALAHGDGHGSGHDVQTVRVVGNGDSVRIDDAQVRAGTIRFEVSTEGAFSAVTLFRLRSGATLDQFFDDVRKEFHPTDLAIRAEGTRDAKRHATFYGLADVVPGFPLAVTDRLRPGTYWLMDLTSPPDPVVDPQVTRLRVTDGGGSGGAQDGDVRVRMQDDRFLAPAVWPRRGTWSLRNADDTVHFMLLQPVRPGTTDDDVQAALEGRAPSPNAPGPAVGSEVLSPGLRHTVDYDLPPGRYVLLCLIADESDGMPHAAMGMHQVVTLR